MECCIRQLRRSSIITCNTTSIAYDHHTDIYPIYLLNINIHLQEQAADHEAADREAAKLKAIALGEEDGGKGKGGSGVGGSSPSKTDRISLTDALSVRTCHQARGCALEVQFWHRVLSCFASAVEVTERTDETTAEDNDNISVGTRSVDGEDSVATDDNSDSESEEGNYTIKELFYAHEEDVLMQVKQTGRMLAKAAGKTLGLGDFTGKLTTYVWLCFMGYLFISLCLCVMVIILRAPKNGALESQCLVCILPYHKISLA